MLNQNMIKSIGSLNANKMETKPHVFITDGLQAYRDAFKREYGAVKK